MKTLFLFTLGALLAISLNARENPFALYEEETGKMYEFNENLTTSTIEPSRFTTNWQITRP